MLTEEQRQKNREACKRWNARNPGASKKKTTDWARRNWESYILIQMKRRAKQKGFECSITKDELKALRASGICAATGIRFIWEGPDKHNPWAPSVDRIDSSKGYTLENCQVVCWIYNWAKGNWHPDVVLEMAKALIKNEGGL